MPNHPRNEYKKDRILTYHYKFEMDNTILTYLNNETSYPRQTDGRSNSKRRKVVRYDFVNWVNGQPSILGVFVYWSRALGHLGQWDHFFDKKSK